MPNVRYTRAELLEMNFREFTELYESIRAMREETAKAFKKDSTARSKLGIGGGGG